MSPAFDIASTPTPPEPKALATTAEVATRMGRDLTDAEEGMAGALLLGATSLIATAAGRTDAWAWTLDPVPHMLNMLCVEAVVRVMLNPRAVSSTQQALGEFSSSEGQRNPNRITGVAGTGALLLTDVEESLVRQAVHGRTSGSGRQRSIADDVLPITRPIELPPL